MSCVHAMWFPFLASDFRHEYTPQISLHCDQLTLEIVDLCADGMPTCRNDAVLAIEVLLLRHEHIINVMLKIPEAPSSE
jgi:hypothetical protein